MHENEFVLLFALICLINYIYAIASQTIMFFSLQHPQRNVERERESEMGRGSKSGGV